MNIVNHYVRCKSEHIASRITIIKIKYTGTRARVVEAVTMVAKTKE